MQIYSFWKFVRPLFLGSYINYVTHFKRGGGVRQNVTVYDMGWRKGGSMSASNIFFYVKFYIYSY